jgi:hypothetical protein
MIELNSAKFFRRILLVAALLAGLLVGCANAANTPLPIEAGPTATEPGANPPVSTSSSPIDEPALETPPAIPAATPTPKFAATPLSEESVIQKTPQPLPQDTTSASLVEQARQDLAERLNVQVEEIDFLDFELVVWPDGSLGCPKPGIAYIQVQREGYKILLGFAGREYAYHGGGSRPPFLCEK